jgi:hypothetical protein
MAALVRDAGEIASVFWKELCVGTFLFFLYGPPTCAAVGSAFLICKSLHLNPKPELLGTEGYLICSFAILVVLAIVSWYLGLIISARTWGW